ncbi:multiple sugar transport system substrate-binding protein [Microbacterium endophyticum]|uniref:Multiple sugar transport system substrate-binding protein n=1 Tax=Microbacterium endophyticum TaxID=1526412 RepID=A0A7W4YNT3_9MICO|nr:sugar ABC transporter substrate-binding protein [Microbacterium endophyticum]MBB2976507.1 multiple sugar transport system substrate-binding protein [Microbacterium endophyticum]NIK35953.1 multiple sugar transport system substrate-binding protein [Microbacterium endophyticum]
MTRKSFRIFATAGAAVAALALSSCSGSAADDGPVTLEYWTWAPAIPEVAEQWNAENPDIQVKVVEAAGADDIVAKLLAAQRAGEGPDIVAAEYQKLPNLVVSDAGLDISEYITDDLRDDFTDATWNLTTVGDGVYAVPQDTGPMVFLYRADLFEQYGLEVPTTWDEYAALAAQVREVAPDSYLGGYPDDTSTLAAYAQPLGAQWWSTDGDAWEVGIDDVETQRVADFWQPLVRDDVVDTTHFFTPEWNTMMNDGTLLSWTAGVWAPGTIESVAPDTAGKWRIAKMPSWDGETTAGLMGGSSAMVSKTSEHPEEAVKFLEWLNGGEGSILLAEGGLFPASIEGQESLSSLPVPAIVEGQDDFWTVAADIASDTAPVTWGPNVQVAFDAWSDSIKSVVASGGEFTDALTATQDATVADLKKTGFTVK